MAFISVTLTGEQWDVCLQALAVAQDRYEEFVQEHEVELAQCLIEEHSKYRDVEHALQVSVANPEYAYTYNMPHTPHVIIEQYDTFSDPTGEQVAPLSVTGGEGGGSGSGGTDYMVL